MLGEIARNGVCSDDMELIKSGRLVKVDWPDKPTVVIKGATYWVNRTAGTFTKSDDDATLPEL